MTAYKKSSTSKNEACQIRFGEGVMRLLTESDRNQTENVCASTEKRCSPMHPPEYTNTNGEDIIKGESHYNRELKREEHLLLQATNEEREEKQEINIYNPQHKDKQSIVPQRSCEEHGEERGRRVMRRQLGNSII
ncbi:hypothetical protein AABB24_009617 [Solanum stoloniferum]|uniref:Uncharacterized protein n=1 Tax=Solanum stoloniferum TaxID=62892 RepID=A0ABD2UK96_9SOLN